MTEECDLSSSNLFPANSGEQKMNGKRCSEYQKSSWRHYTSLLSLKVPVLCPRYQHTLVKVRKKQRDPQGLGREKGQEPATERWLTPPQPPSRKEKDISMAEPETSFPFMWHNVDKHSLPVILQQNGKHRNFRKLPKQKTYL